MWLGSKALVALSRKYVLTGDSEDITEQYEKFLPHNKVIAEPLVRKVYELDKIRGGYEAINSRQKLMDKIANKDKAERLVTNIDNSDIDTVKYMLESYEALSR